jgi:hypothetical protein
MKIIKILRNTTNEIMSDIYTAGTWMCLLLCFLEAYCNYKPLLLHQGALNRNCAPGQTQTIYLFNGKMTSCSCLLLAVNTFPQT